MKAIILAAGRGSRMGALTDEQPKCLTVIRRKPLIEHQVSALSSAGIEEIAIVTGYKAEMLQSYGTYHFHNPKWAESNIVASLLCAREWLDSNDCIVSYSDIFYESQIVKDLMQCDDNVAIAYDPNWLELWSRRFENPLDDAETFRMDSLGYITEIGQKAKAIDEIQGQYMGLLKFKKNFWHSSLIANEEEVKQIDMTSFLQKLVVKNIKVKACSNLSYWGEFDKESDLKLVIL